MDKMLITNQSLQDDGTNKVSYKATFANNTYVTGHVMMSQEDLEEMSLKDIRKAVAEDIITNLGGSPQ